MSAFRQEGGCVCRDIRFAVREEPLTVYACHCTDCQIESGSAFTLAAIVKRNAFEFTRGEPVGSEVVLADGRSKGGYRCGRCNSAFGGPSRIETLQFIEAGTFDDTSWIRPAGHIWTRSAQPWIELADDTLQFEKQPSDEDFVSLVRHYKTRDG